MIAGALNWLLVGIFDLNLVALIFGGTNAVPGIVTRIVYAVIGLAGLYGIAMLAKLVSDREDVCVPGHYSTLAGQIR
jgi:uncharacterized membrane protein YuzA (DUF378 family)